MATALSRADPVERVALIDDGVCIEWLTHRSPELVCLVQTSTDPVATVHECLAAGARGLAVVRSGLDSSLLDRTAADVERRMRAANAEFAERVAATAKQLLGAADGSLPTMLQTWRQEVAEHLAAAVDPNRRDSLLARVDESVGQLLEQHTSAMRSLLSPDADDGPLHRLLAATDARLVPLTEEVRRLRELLISTQAAETALERSAVKGLAYEELVGQAVTDAAAVAGDVAEPVGRAPGAAGTKHGDIVVTTGGARYVVEAKDRRLPLGRALAEARSAMLNREAAAAAVVFSGTRACPVGAPLAVFDDVAVVVLEKSEPDPLALEVACASARARALTLRDPNRSVDVETIGEAIGRAEQALNRATGIRRSLGMIRKESERAGADVTALVTEIREQLTVIGSASGNP